MATLKRKRACTVSGDHKLDTQKRKLLVDGADVSLSTEPPSEDGALLAKLRALLDLTGLTSQEDISARFDAIADVLLHDVVLRVVDAKSHATDLEILELEFYLYKVGCHEDPFTHGTEEQRQSGNWYFHRAPRRNQESENSEARAPTAAGGYRGGTRKGLDLTFGGPVSFPPPNLNAPVASKFFAKPPSTPPPTGPDAPVVSTNSSTTMENVRGGVLLRTIQRTSDAKLFSGPSLLVDGLLRLSGAANLSELVTQLWDNDVSAFPVTSITPAGRPTLRLHAKQVPAGEKRETMYKSPRIGLDLSHASIPLPQDGIEATLAHPRVTFISRKYRYLTHPALLTANGRGHTFLAVHDALLVRSDASLADEIAGMTGLKGPTAKKYLDEYQAARKTGVLRGCVGSAGKGAGSTPVSFLRLMGTLERCREAK